MGDTNGRRSEKERLQGKPVKLFTIMNTPQGARTVEVPLLPAGAAMDWVEIYDAALDLQNELISWTGYYEAKGPQDWGKNGDACQSREQYLAEFRQRKRAVVAAYYEAFWRYGEIYADATGKDNPLPQDELEPLVNAAQVMDALTRLHALNDPLSCWGASSLERANEQKATIGG